MRPPLTYSRVVWITRVSCQTCSWSAVSVVRTYICTGTVLLFVLVYIPGTSIFFIWGHVHYSCTVHCCSIICIYIYVCVTTAVCVCRTMFVYMALTTWQGYQSCSWSAAEQGKCIIRCPRSRLRIWSRETGSAVPSRVSLLISILRAESSACLRDSSRVPRRRPFIIDTHHVL